MKDNSFLAYFLFRLTIGASLFGHGLVRMPKLQGFSHWMVNSFQKSMIPAELVLIFSYILPFAELIIGLLLLLGLFTRTALVAGAIVMILLILGTTSIENWDAIPTQLIHGAFLVVLLWKLPFNTISADRKIFRKG